MGVKFRRESRACPRTNVFSSVSHWGESVGRLGGEEFCFLDFGDLASPNAALYNLVHTGLVGMLLLFGVRPASQVIAAVLIYRALSLWIPALIGSLAFLSLRRDIGKPLARAVPG